MTYNKEDIKKIGLRTAKSINHDLQRSKMNEYFKPYFTESSIQFIDNEDFIGIALNSRPLNIEDSLDEMEEVRFLNNMRLLQETVLHYLKRDKLENLFELKSFSESSALMDLCGNYTEKYKNFALAIKKEAIDINAATSDMIDDKVKSMVPGFTVNTYEITPDDIAGATTKDLKDEVTIKTDNRVLANPIVGKMTVPNSSSYSYLKVNSERHDSDILI